MSTNERRPASTLLDPARIRKESEATARAQQEAVREATERPPKR